MKTLYSSSPCLSSNLWGKTMFFKHHTGSVTHTPEAKTKLRKHLKPLLLGGVGVNEQVHTKAKLPWVVFLSCFISICRFGPSQS